jgi:hypothetical protein
MKNQMVSLHHTLLLIILFAFSFINSGYANLLNIEKPQFGFSILLPEDFTELQRTEGTDTIFTYNGFGGKASIVIRLGTVKNSNLTPKLLAAVYEKKIIKDAIPEETEELFFDLKYTEGIKKKYSTQNLLGQRINISALYIVSSSRFYICHISTAKNLIWHESEKIISSFTIFDTNSVSLNAPDINNDKSKNFNESRLPEENQFSKFNNYDPFEQSIDSNQSHDISNYSQSNKSTIPLTINSFPEGAKVFINNKHAGFTPFSTNFLNDGVHEISLYKDGYNIWKRQIKLDSKTIAMIDAYLVKNSIQTQTNETHLEKDNNKFRKGYRYYNYSHVDAADNLLNPTNSSEQNLIKDKNIKFSNKIKNYEKSYEKFDSLTKKYENHEFRQNRPIRLNRRKEKELKNLYRSIMNNSRLINEQFGNDPEFHDLLSRYSILQRRIRNLNNLIK